MNDRFFLTSDESQMLIKLANKTGMDCWFRIYTDIDGANYVFDAENDKVISVRDGVRDLVDGLTEEDLSRISPRDVFVLVQLLGRLL